ncbi:MAG TPA: hypothetical protein PK467_09075, partial [Candidatus Wallbacteria bacterium]|nr:hypothetical protein [Candidatus Wallbacteria bacterium]
YPAGISATRSETWSPQSGTYDTLNAYVVDSVLDVNGTLEILAGTLVKFATADKSVNNANWSGKANSCIRVGTNGKLYISGGLKESERVLFTSLDDSTAAPSAYSSGDLNSKSADGLANPQPMRVKSGATERLCGAKYGDWGKSDGTAANSLGGLYLPAAGCAVINNLQTRYALLYTKSI